MVSKEILKKIRKIHIRTNHVVNDMFAGEYESAFRGRGMQFEEVREYSPGDDVRDIDWNVTARFGHPFVKVYREERFRLYDAHSVNSGAAIRPILENVSVSIGRCPVGIRYCEHSAIAVIKPVFRLITRRREGAETESAVNIFSRAFLESH